MYTYSFSFGQGTVRGKVTDKNGEALIGATISLKSNHSVGVATDFDGNYSIKISDTSSSQTLVVSYISYKTIEESVRPANSKIIIKNFVLASASSVMNEVVITAKVVKTKDTYMQKVKMNSATTLDYISAETMKKTGDVSVVSAVARVSGVSTNGGFITVRGIGDRYVKTTINGSRIPTLDPFTNNIKLDMFPASLVDNILITKTASPDLPGDWAGAYLSVETKDYPDNLSVNVETSAGYNNQTSFKEVLSSQRSSTDWLGYDNGFRDHEQNPNGPAVTVNKNPTTYQEFVAIGLGDYYKSLGVTNNTTWNDTYYKLGLVQLGLLDKANFNDANAFNNAKKLYETGPYKAQAFVVINTGAVKLGQSFPNNWNTTIRKVPLNFTQSFSVGNQIQLFGKPLGYLFGFRYGSSMLYDPNSTANRTFVDVKGVSGFSSEINQQLSRETNGWSALMNLAYKFNPNNSLSLLFMPNFTGVNNVRNAIDNSDYTAIKSQFYEQRKQLVYQLKSEHYISGPKLKVELNASYTNGKSSAPDFKDLNYGALGGGAILNVDRYFRYLTDNLFDSRLSAELPIGNSESNHGPRKFKFGGAYQSNEKKSDQYDYSLQSGTGNLQNIQNNNIDQAFSLDQFGINYSTVYSPNPGIPFPVIYKYYQETGNPSNHSFGNSEVMAGFVMLDYSIIPSLRISGGLRIEKANIYTDVYKYDSLSLASNDQRRHYPGETFLVNPGKLDALSYLPSANIIYKLKQDEQAPINLRLNYSKTVARPSIRELSDIVVYDYELRDYVFGNSNLKMVQINNYDLRLESYFKSGDNVSVSIFYKDFKNHIELVQSSNQGYTWQNVDKSRVMGLEMEGRKAITKHLELRANATFVNSLTTFVETRLSIGNDGVKTFIPIDTVSRSMYGQAPYVLNGILAYSADSIGLYVAISYNVQGPRLVIATPPTGTPYKVPDVYELPRHLIDFKITKSLGKHFSTSFTIRDILNAPIRRSYKYAEGWIDYDKYRYGTNYVLSILYKI